MLKSHLFSWVMWRPYWEGQGGTANWGCWFDYTLKHLKTTVKLLLNRQELKLGVILILYRSLNLNQNKKMAILYHEYDNITV